MPPWLLCLLGHGYDPPVLRARAPVLQAGQEGTDEAYDEVHLREGGQDHSPLLNVSTELTSFVHNNLHRLHTLFMQFLDP